MFTIKTLYKGSEITFSYTPSELFRLNTAEELMDDTDTYKPIKVYNLCLPVPPNSFWGIVEHKSPKWKGYMRAEQTLSSLGGFTLMLVTPMRRQKEEYISALNNHIFNEIKKDFGPNAKFAKALREAGDEILNGMDEDEVMQKLMKKLNEEEDNNEN